MSFYLDISAYLIAALATSFGIVPVLASWLCDVPEYKESWMIGHALILVVVVLGVVLALIVWAFERILA